MVYRVYIIFFPIFALKHRFWELVRTASHTSYVLEQNKANITIFHLKVIVLQHENCSVLHRRVIVMILEPRCEKTVIGVSDHVPHKSGCTATEDGWRLEISYLGRREIVLFV